MSTFGPLSGKSSVFSLVFATGFALYLAACATIFSGTKQDVSISSAPQQASVGIVKGFLPMVPNGMGGVQGAPQVTMGYVAQGTTPMVANLAREDEYTVIISLPGYQPAMVRIEQDFNPMVILNIFCLFVIGGAIDLVTGAFWDLEPEQIMVALQPAGVIMPTGGPTPMPGAPQPMPGAPQPMPMQPGIQQRSSVYEPTGADMYATLIARDSHGQYRYLMVPLFKTKKVASKS